MDVFGFLEYCESSPIFKKPKQKEKQAIYTPIKIKRLNQRAQQYGNISTGAFIRVRTSEKNKILFRKDKQMFISNNYVQQAVNPIVIGYYPVRAKAQLCRLLCEYLHVPYIDQYLNPTEWDEFKRNEAKNWIIKDLPFLVDGNFVVTGSTGCSYYIIQKAQRLELFGRTIEDNIKITTYGNRKDLIGAVMGLICKVKANRTIEEIKLLKKQFAAKIEPILHIHEKEAKENDWYLGYLSLMDFVIYIAMTQLDQFFPEEIPKFNRLNALKQRFLQIPEIYSYQNSARAVKCYNPVEYFNSFKQQMMKNMPNDKFGQMSTKEMDVE